MKIHSWLCILSIFFHCYDHVQATCLLGDWKAPESIEMDQVLNEKPKTKALTYNIVHSAVTNIGFATLGIALYETPTLTYIYFYDQEGKFIWRFRYYPNEQIIQVNYNDGTIKKFPFVPSSQQKIAEDFPLDLSNLHAANEQADLCIIQ